MATYYVRTPANGGNDGNAGTSTSTAWASFTKVFSASGFTTGDTVYVEPGVYREVVTAVNTSPTTRAYVIGDYNGAIFGTVGEVRWTSHTTDDDTAGSTTTLLNINGRDNITIRGIRFEACGRALDVGAGSTFIDIEDCVIVAQGNGGIAFTSGNTVALNCNLRRCIVHGISDAVLITPNTTSGNLVVNMNIENCVITARLNRAINFSNSGGANTASGCTVKNCTITGPTGITSTGARYSTAGGIEVLNCLLYLCSSGVAAGTSGQIVMTNTRTAMCTTPTTLIATNTNGSNGNASIDQGASFLYDLTPRRPWYMPYITGIIAGDGTATGAPTDDIHNTTRPNPPAVGASEITTLYTTGGLKTHPGMTGGIRG